MYLQVYVMKDKIMWSKCLRLLGEPGIEGGSQDHGSVGFLLSVACLFFTVLGIEPRPHAC